MKTRTIVTTVKEKALTKAARVSALFLIGLSQTTGMTAFADEKVTTTNATEKDLEKATKPVIDLLNNILNILIPLVAAAGAIFCISLGVKYARAEEPQDREKAKAHLKNAIIGFVLIFVLIVVLRLSTPALTRWMGDNSSN
jgi:cytochrome c biogenesis protein CcdA